MAMLGLWGGNLRLTPCELFYKVFTPPSLHLALSIDRVKS